MDIKTLKELMETTPQNLAEKQFLHLKEHVVNTLYLAAQFIDGHDFMSAEDMTFESPAGDGHGMDNSCIDFSYEESETMDFLEVVGKLKMLYEMWLLH